MPPSCAPALPVLTLHLRPALISPGFSHVKIPAQEYATRSMHVRWCWMTTITKWRL